MKLFKCFAIRSETYFVCVIFKHVFIFSFRYQILPQFNFYKRKRKDLCTNFAVFIASLLNSLPYVIWSLSWLQTYLVWYFICLFCPMVHSLSSLIMYELSFTGLDILLFQVSFTNFVHWDGVHANQQL